jgi:hypothetical protein
MLLLAVVVTNLSKELDHRQHACMYVCMYVCACAYIYMCRLKRERHAVHMNTCWSRPEEATNLITRIAFENFEACCTSRDARLNFRF